MKLAVDFRQLFANVRKMGVKEWVDFSVDFNSKLIEIEVGELETTKGLEVPLEDIEIDPQSGVFTYQGKHIVLFIPDHSFKYNEVILNPKVSGNKYHLTDCATLENMRRIGRFKRYHATRNRTGVFRIFGITGQESEVPLSVCKNCLNKLNYQNYNRNRTRIFDQFSLEEFFTYYETFFRNEPEDVGQNEVGYAENWAEISHRYRLSVSYCCENCGVNLSRYKYLLEVHHKNGVKRDNRPENFRALCRLCHSEEEHHQHIKISDIDRQLIENLRKKGTFDEDIPF